MQPITFHNSSHSRSSRAALCRAMTALTSDWTTFAFISTCSATVCACSMLSWKSKQKLEALEGTSPLTSWIDSSFQETFRTRACWHPLTWNSELLAKAESLSLKWRRGCSGQLGTVSAAGAQVRAEPEALQRERTALR